MCNFDRDCSEDLYCKNDVCVPELATGSPCDEFVDTCLNGSCDAGTCVENGDLGSAGLAFACVLIANGGFPQP
jgi:hypothetical protein